MNILGIDPGLRISGFGILSASGNKTFLIDSGFLSLPQTKGIPERISIFHDFFTKKIVDFCITAIAVETPFMGKNAQNFMKLGYLRGIVNLLSHKHDIPVYEFAPRSVKLSVTGFGGASKEQVASVVLRLFPRLEKPKKEDVTDALAVALCGLWHGENSYLLKSVDL